MARPKKETTQSGCDEKVLPKDIKSLLTKVINSKFKEPVAYELGKEAPTNVSDWISTGSTLLDYISSNRRDGGVPAGKLTEIVGIESSGKSLICMQLAASTQKKGGFVVYIDTETSLNKDFAKRVGIDIEELFYAVPQTMEEVFETIEESVKKIRTVNSDVPITIIWDSVAGTPTKSEIEGTFNPQELIGIAARIISKAMRKLMETIAREKITLVFTNQLKTAIGKMTWGDPMKATYGGKAIPYHASLRMRLKKVGEIKIANEVVGVATEAKIIKSKVSPPFRVCKFPITFNNGVDNITSIFEALKERKIIDQRGAWSLINFKGEEFRFNKPIFRDKMKENEFNEFIMSVIEENMIIRYDDDSEKKLAELDIDLDSAIEVEAVSEAISEIVED